MARHLVHAVCDTVVGEMVVFWHFTWRDWSTTIIPGMTYTTAALRSLNGAASTKVVLASLLRSFIYFLLFGYSFNILNQITGIAEDRVDKPDRPIPSGRVSLEGAYVRWYTTTFVFLLVGAVWGVFPSTIVWVIITIHNNYFDGGKHWFSKNLFFISVGTFCILKGAWELVTPMDPRELRWALLQSGVWGIAFSVQDLRDIEGDKLTGRRTLPIVLGNNFRWVTATMILMCQFIFWLIDLLDGFGAIILAFSMCYLAYRVLTGRSKEEDHKTYMILTYIFCGVFAGRAMFS